MTEQVAFIGAAICIFLSGLSAGMVLGIYTERKAWNAKIQSGAIPAPSEASKR